MNEYLIKQGKRIETGVNLSADLIPLGYAASSIDIHRGV